ncbi:MAG: hypothetical protein F9K18_00915 [Thermoanaerobaculia bacterium]|nr:MAG: hypothetical protein F9K18_00915 [Thermoanaerobaculia bacterium]
MAKGTAANCVARLSEAIGSTVAPAGFDRNPEIFGGDRVFRRFRRRHGWKVDIIDLAHRRMEPSFFDVGLFVCFQLEDYEHQLDGQSLVQLVGGDEYRLVTSFGFLHDWRCARTARRAANDLSRSLHWFDRLATPRQCLDFLGTPESLSPGPGSPIYIAMREHLLRADRQRP